MNGLFVGLTTLDLIYLISELPQSNQKIVALEQTIAAGGPATNAAITFSHLANQATIVSVVGQHPLSQLIFSDLNTYAVNLIDLDPTPSETPAISSILVLQSTGDRSVISVNATKKQATPKQLSSNILQDIDLILIDGHQMEISQTIAQNAKIKGIPIVIDGGSWKAGFEEVLLLADYVICSANFYPPQCQTQADVLGYLSCLGIPQIAITQGQQPILYQVNGKLDQIEITPVQTVDTLGAGDVFHGAFCHYILQTQKFSDALAKAAQVAAYSCQFFGTRQWMHYQNEKKARN